MAVFGRRRFRRRSLELALIGLAVTMTIAAGVAATIHAYQLRLTRVTALGHAAMPTQHAENLPARWRR